MDKRKLHFKLKSFESPKEPGMTLDENKQTEQLVFNHKTNQQNTEYRYNFHSRSY